MKITPEEFELIAGYIHRISGIRLDGRKAYLIETRLKPLLKESGCASYMDLYRKARTDVSGGTEERIIDAISTNETLFFRDSWPFELLEKKILPDIVASRKAGRSGTIPIRIWSAGCSTGQEVYSIAISLREILGDPGKYDITLLGTDISATAVRRAARGEYNPFETDRGLTEERRRRYFAPGENESRIRDDIRGLAEFRKHNLMDSFGGLGRFDIVFCRNVSIYFCPECQKKLFRDISEVMDPGGYLITGSTESVTGFCPRFELRKHSGAFFYQLRD